MRFCAEHRDEDFPTPGYARRFLGAWGKEKCLLLIRFRAAYGIGSDLLEAACGEQDPPPGNLSQLKIGGREIAALGATGPEIGEILNRLLALAAECAVKNEPAALLEAARRLLGI